MRGSVPSGGVGVGVGVVLLFKVFPVSAGGVLADSGVGALAEAQFLGELGGQVEAELLDPGDLSFQVVQQGLLGAKLLGAVDFLVEMVEGELFELLRGHGGLCSSAGLGVFWGKLLLFGGVLGGLGGRNGGRFARLGRLGSLPSLVALGLVGSRCGVLVVGLLAVVLLQPVYEVCFQPVDGQVSLLQQIFQLGNGVSGIRHGARWAAGDECSGVSAAVCCCLLGTTRQLGTFKKTSRNQPTILCRRPHPLWPRRFTRKPVNGQGNTNGKRAREPLQVLTLPPASCPCQNDRLPRASRVEPGRGLCKGAKVRKGGTAEGQPRDICGPENVPRLSLLHDRATLRGAVPASFSRCLALVRLRLLSVVPRVTRSGAL